MEPALSAAARRWRGPARALLWLLLVLALADPRAAQAAGHEVVTVVTRAGGHFPFHVEIADTPLSRARGLMFREHLAADQGMLFLFDEVAPVSFWMKNTPLSLDMLFIAPDGRIADLHRDAVPYSTRPIDSAAPVLAVLEVLAGTAKKLGIRVGDRVEHRAFQQH